MQLVVAMQTAGGVLRAFDDKYRVYTANETYQSQENVSKVKAERDSCLIVPFDLVIHQWSVLNSNHGGFVSPTRENEYARSECSSDVQNNM